MKRVYNFSAGPGVLPEEVLEKAQVELLNYKDSGMSVMEMSHRSKDYMAIIDDARTTLKRLMYVPDDYEILFLQGGASTQFAMIPLNLFSENGVCDAINTGSWSKKAIAEAKRYGKVNVVASSEDQMFSYIPKWDEKDFDPNADYFYITTNNTIYGTRFTKLPKTGNVPLIADMSSNILSQSYDINQFGMVFAGAQKNMGPAGVTVVIIKKDLIGKAKDFTPTMLDYQTHADNESMFNTPPTFAIYMCGLVYQWIKDMGGVEQMEKHNIEKANILYDFLDESKLFKGTVNKEDRSLMNVPFVTGKEDLDADFIKQAKEKSFVNLKGHRSVGGMRASIYNAMPMEGVQALVDFMKEFEVQNT